MVICLLKWGQGKGADIPKSGTTARTLTTCEEEIIFGWSRRDKKSMDFKGTEPAGCFILILSLIQFDCRDVLFIQYFVGSNVFGKVACFFTIAPGFTLPLEKHQSWERSSFSEQSSNNSRAVSVILYILLRMRSCYLGDNPAHLGYTSLPSELCCFFASLFICPKFAKNFLKALQFRQSSQPR